MRSSSAGSCEPLTDTATAGFVDGADDDWMVAPSSACRSCARLSTASSIATPASACAGAANERKATTAASMFIDLRCEVRALFSTGAGDPQDLRDDKGGRPPPT